MTSDKRILEQLVGLLVQGQVAIFLGPDLPETLTGVPGWPELASRLVARGFPTGDDWPTVAAHYVQALGRRDLIDWLDDQVSGKIAGSIYQELAALPVSKFIAATYDGLLQSALETADRPANIVVEEADLNFIKPERPTVVKLLGEVSPGRRDTLLLTASDMRSLAQYRSKILAQEVLPVFTRQSLLILGQDIDAEIFQALYYQDPPRDNPLRRQAFAIQTGMETWKKESWGADKLTIIEAEPLAFVKQLLLALESQPSKPLILLPEKPQSLEPPPPAVPPAREKAPAEATPAEPKKSAAPKMPQQPLIDQVPRMARAFTFPVLGILAVLIAMALLIPDQRLLTVILGAAVVLAVLVFVTILLAVGVLPPEIGERLFSQVLRLPLAGRIAGRSEDTAAQQRPDEIEQK